jgi:hypothetical protein
VVPGVWPGQAQDGDALQDLLVAVQERRLLVEEEVPVLAVAETLGPLDPGDVVELVLMDQDRRPGLLEQAQPAGVVGVQVTLDDVLEVLRPQAERLQPRLQAHLRRHRLEVNQHVLPFRMADGRRAVCSMLALTHRAAREP